MKTLTFRAIYEDDRWWLEEILTPITEENYWISELIRKEDIDLVMREDLHLEDPIDGTRIEKTVVMVEDLWKSEEGINFDYHWEGVK